MSTAPDGIYGTLYRPECSSRLSDRAAHIGGVNLFSALGRELLGSGGKVIERAMTLKADILVPG